MEVVLKTSLLHLFCSHRRAMGSELICGNLSHIVKVSIMVNIVATNQVNNLETSLMEGGNTLLNKGPRSVEAELCGSNNGLRHQSNTRKVQTHHRLLISIFSQIIHVGTKVII
jgi:hypothetical protein